MRILNAGLANRGIGNCCREATPARGNRRSLPAARIWSIPFAPEYWRIGPTGSNRTTQCGQVTLRSFVSFEKYDIGYSTFAGITHRAQEARSPCAAAVPPSLAIADLLGPVARLQLAQRAAD